MYILLGATFHSLCIISIVHNFKKFMEAAGTFFPRQVIKIEGPSRENLRHQTNFALRINFFALLGQAKASRFL